MEERESSDKNLSNANKNQNIYWPYLIKLNQFNKNINNKNNCIRIGLTSKKNLNIEFYYEEDPNNSFHKNSLNISEIQNINDIFKSKKNMDEIYNFIFEILFIGEFDIKNSNKSKDEILLLLFYNKNEINITLKKEKISFVNEYNYELNGFINKLYDEVLLLRKSLNNKSVEHDEKMKVIMKENIDIIKKLAKIENENINQQNEINSLKKTITEIKNKNNVPKTSSKNYLRKQDIINSINQTSNNDEEGDEVGLNNNQYYNYLPDYYNNVYYYFQDGINSITNNNDIQDINDYINNYNYYYNNDDYYSINYNNDNNLYNDNQNDYYNNIESNNIDEENNYPYNSENENVANKNISQKNDEKNISVAEEKTSELMKNNNENNIYLNLTDFNKKYNTNFKDNKMKKLELGSKKLGNSIFNEIPKYDFFHIIKLYLCDNDITDINNLILWKNPNLEKLYLSNNKIKDISILAKVNFNKLETLYMDNNLINEITIFSKVNFPNLMKLSLHNNQIKDISILEFVNFSKLVFLSLHDNNINDINVFKKVKFPDLETLYLNNNYINDLSCFYNIDSFKLNQLYLYNNSNIDLNRYKTIISNLKKKIMDLKI